MRYEINYMNFYVEYFKRNLMQVTRRWNFKGKILLIKTIIILCMVLLVRCVFKVKTLFVEKRVINRFFFAYFK